MNKLLIATLIFFQSSIYSLSFSTAGGVTVKMEQYKGKKMLIVNIATDSKRVNQLGELEQLQQRYQGQVVIIAFPSNSFSNETKDNEEIRRFCQDTYHTSFVIAAKAPVADNQIHPVYRWLTSQSENGVMGGEIKSDFQKYLIDETGKLVGVFAPGLCPLDNQMTDAVTATY